MMSYDDRRFGKTIRFLTLSSACPLIACIKLIKESILSWTVRLLETMANNKGGGILQNQKVDELNR